MVAVESRTASRRGAATPSPSTPARRSVRPLQHAWAEEEEEGRSVSDRASPAAQPPSLEDYRWSRLPVAARGFRDNARRALSRQDLPHSPVGRRRGRLGSPVLSRLFFFLADQTSMSGPDLPLPPHQLSNQDAEDLPDVDALVQERRFRQTCIRRYRHFARRMERWREARLRGTSPSLGSPTPASSPSVDRSPTPTKSSTGAVASPMWKRLAHAAQQAATFTSRTAAAVGRTLLPGEEEVEQAPTSDSTNDDPSSKEESSCSPSSSLMMSEGRSSSDASSVASRCRPPPSPRRARSHGLPRRLLRTCKSFFATRIATLRRGGTSTRHDDDTRIASIATRLRRQLIQAPPSSWDQPLISPEELQRLHAPTLPHWIVHRQQKLSAHRGQNVVPSATVEAVEVASHAISLESSAEDRTAAVVSSSSSIPDHDVVLRLAQSILSSSPFHRKDPVPTLLPPLGTQPMPCEEVKQPYSASHDASTNQPHRTSILYSSSPTYGTPPRFPHTDGQRRRRQSPEARQHEAHRSLLSSLTIRPRDESIRNIYDNVVSEACQHYMKEAISSVVEEMGGAALRCASELLLREGLRAIRASSSTTPSVGVLRHIRAGRPMDCNTMELDEEDRAALAKLEQTSIHNHVGSSLRSDGFQVTYGHLSSLLPRQWLNDQVINNYLQLLCEEAEDEGAISLGTHFYAKIQSELGMNHHHHHHNAHNNLPQLPANAAAVRWLRRRRHLLLPYDRHASRVAEQPSLTHTHVRVVLIPINLDAQHWALAVWDKVHNVWTFYDSMGASPRAQEMAAHLLRVLDHVMRECHRHLFPSTTASMTVSRIQAAVPCDHHHISSGGVGAMVRARQAAYTGTKTHMVEDGTQEDLCHGWAKAPQQHNGYDCGVFVCQVAWCVVKGTAVAITQRQMTTMRRIMALELVAARLLLRYPSELSEGGDDVLATPSSISIFPTLAAFVGSSAAQIGLSTGEVSPAAHRELYR